LIYHIIKYKYFTQAFLKIKHCIAQLQSEKADFFRSLTSKYDLDLKYRIPVKVRDTFILISKIIWKCNYLLHVQVKAQRSTVWFYTDLRPLGIILILISNKAFVHGTSLNQYYTFCLNCYWKSQLSLIRVKHKWTNFELCYHVWTYINNIENNPSQWLVQYIMNNKSVCVFF